MEIAVIIVVALLGFVAGLYTSSQITKSISKNIEITNDDVNLDGDIEEAVKEYYEVEEEKVDYPRTGGLSPDTGPRH